MVVIKRKILEWDRLGLEFQLSTLGAVPLPLWTSVSLSTNGSSLFLWL